MYINDGMLSQNTLTTSGSSSQNIASIPKTMSYADFKKTLVSPITVTKPNQALQPIKVDSPESIVFKSDEKPNMLDNKYLLYGGIGLVALGLLYFIYKD